MDAATLSELRKPRAYPAVSVLMPTSRRPPENQQDPIRLRNLLTEVRRRLHEDTRVTDDIAERMYRTLEEASQQLDLRREAEDGLVLFAGPDGEHHVFTIDQSVDERVIVDTSFATRDLVAAYTRSRSSKYWLLVLTEQCTRLMDVQGEEITEHAGAGFPVRPLRLDEKFGNRSAPGGSPNKDEPQRQLVRKAVSALDKVLAHDRRPVIVAAVTRHQALFDEYAAPQTTVAGRIDGSYDEAPPAVLADLARPVRAAYEDLREVAVLTELEAARGLDRYAAGLPDVMRMVEEGRGEHLVVERGYYASAVKTDGGEFVPVDGRPGALRGADVVDDAVDNVIESALEYGGEVTFVSDGFLVDHGRIALVLRF
ncbi:baeRF3 domain-containing protein [Actinomadura macrotermitis]|uniref:Chemotaxis protein n=1 Tax=Actinomadura macrotermitis TaxID=2585200 RepID=A0A7K0BN25_9ACTN|nr:hypothetical protein [Actinomadura macrotermitis]MQY02578.1 hypothetical protein [Actinomadura macrotermitis]